MNSIFRHVALIGKYHASLSGRQSDAMRRVLEDIAEYLAAQGCEILLERETANNASLAGYPLVNVPEIGARCDLGLVVGGDGTMLGIGRQLAPFGVPLIGINQGRLGFITDISLEKFRATLTPMLRGEYVEDRRSLMHARVMRDGHCVFDVLAMNDVVVNRGAISGMVELRVEVGGHFVANQRADGLIIATPTGATAYALSPVGQSCTPPSPAGYWCPSRPILCPTARLFCLTTRRSRSRSSLDAMPAPILTCNPSPRCSTATALLCGDRNIACDSCIRAAGAISIPFERSSTGTKEDPDSGATKYLLARLCHREGACP